jgi:3-hydroxyisobutyrate dehydrogenase
MSSDVQTTSAVAIIGTGNMGGGMARNLLSRGFTVHVCDLDDSKTQALQALGAQVHSSPVSLADVAPLLIVCVVTADEVQDVLLGAQGVATTLRPGQTVMLCPTIAPHDVERFAQQLLALGVHTIDAPMSGGPVRATEGTMSLMVACADAVFAQHAPVLQVLSNQLFRISTRVGDGARTKLVNNLLAGINLVGAAEALALAERMGLSAHTTLDVMSQSSGQSWIGMDRMQRALANDWAPRAHMTLLTKDTRLACEAAAAVGFDGPLGRKASCVFAQACEAGLSDVDDGALLQLLRNHPSI